MQINSFGGGLSSGETSQPLEVVMNETIAAEDKVVSITMEDPSGCDQ